MVNATGEERHTRNTSAEDKMQARMMLGQSNYTAYGANCAGASLRRVAFKNLLCPYLLRECFSGHCVADYCMPLTTGRLYRRPRNRQLCFHPLTSISRKVPSRVVGCAFLTLLQLLEHPAIRQAASLRASVAKEPL